MALMDKYRDRGMKLTPQRLAIFRYLEGNRNHPSAEDIFRAVSRKFPTMSFATVYNTLAALRDKGKVRELTCDPDKKRYDPDTEQHNHLICDSCSRVVDVPIAFDLRLPPGLKNDFTVMSNHVEFHGFCSQCRKQK
jgi:Fur family peroxide stress response transcriptional regulator